MSLPYRWYHDPLLSRRRLDGHVLVHHSGSGDTHLLNTVSDRLLAALPTAPPGCSLDDLAAQPGVADLGASESELTDALILLEEAGLVRSVTDG